jgi:hypothetical protein
MPIMPYSGDLLKISGNTVPGLKQYKVTYAKLWKDADRNMNGDVTATFIGIFPKLELEIGGKITENGVSTLINLLNAAYFSVTHFDPKSKTTRTASYYASDFSIDMLEKERGLYKPFTVDLIPVSKASY